MLRRVLPALTLALMLILVSCGSPEPPPVPEETAVQIEPGAVQLVLFLVVDQCTTDLLQRFSPLLDDGFRTFIDQGAYFTEAHHFHARTTTAVGHATLSTGCFPGRHGIVDNYWYDQETGERVYAVDDPELSTSPLRLLSPSLGDWLKAADGKSKVFAASGKDRAAVLMGGRDADGAFWCDAKKGTFTSSDYYYPDGEPAWVDDFNDQRHLEKHFGEAWEPLPVDQEALEAAGIANTDFGPLHPVFPHVFGVASPAPNRYFFQGASYSPWGDELLALFGRRIIEAEELGADGHPDLLILSFSVLDWVGHDYGPNSREALDTMMRLDGYLGGLLEFIDDTVGLEHTLIGISSDHGVAPVPELLAARGEPGSRLTAESVLCFQQAGRQLDQKYGDQDWFLPGPRLNPAAVEGSGVAREELEQTLAALLSDCPAVQKIWTRSDLRSGSFPDDPYFTYYRNNYHEDRSPDLMVQYEPFHNATRGSATTHGTPYRYDTHVPLIIFGPGVPAGRVHERVNTVDLAPTLAALAGIPVPAEIDGRSLVPNLEDVRMVLNEEDLAAAEPVALESGTP